MSEPNLQQRILEVFRKFGDPCTRAEAIEMLAEPDVPRADFGSRLANLVRYGHINATLGKDGITRYQFASAVSRKGRKVKAPEQAAEAKPSKRSRAEPAAEPKAKRKYTRKPRVIGAVVAVTDNSIQVESDQYHAELQTAATTGSATRVDAEAFTTNTLTLTADQARELAVITLSHPRPLSERMRKTVIELVRIAA